MKRIFVILLSLMLTLNTFTSVYAGEVRKGFAIEYGGKRHNYNSKVVSLVINGEEVKTGDMPAVIVDGRTLVPVREVFESKEFGARVDWNGDTKEVYIFHKDKYIILKIDSDSFYVNGKKHKLDVPAMLIRDTSKKYAKTMVPLRFVSEYLGFDVDWEEKTYTAALKSEEYKYNERLARKSEEKTKRTVTSEDKSGVKSNKDEPTMEKERDSKSEVTGISGKVVKKETKKDHEKHTGKKLDSIDDKGTKRTLPTSLRDNPVVFRSKYDDPTIGTVIKRIIPQDNEVTILNDLRYNIKEDSFEIGATSEVSDIEVHKWESKYIIDIKNAVNDLPPANNYPGVVEKVRTSQYSKEPAVTRIVFDLTRKEGNFYTYLSDDRKTIIVKKKENYISKMSLKQDKKGDYLDIQGTSSPELTIFRLASPNRVVIDMPETTSLIAFMEKEANGQYIKKMRTAQFEEGMTRVVLETYGQPDYKIERNKSTKSTKISFFEPNYENIGYENKGDKPTIHISEDGKSIDLSKVTYKNNYLKKEFVITLPGDYKNKFGKGSLKVKDGIIEEVSFKNVNGKTVITIHSTSIYEFRVKKENGKLVVRAYKPKELYDRVLVVDPGHGGKDPGAHGYGLLEKTLNLQVVEELKQFFDKDSSVKVYYTRLGDSYPTLQGRCDIANDVNADMFLSVHHNAFYSKHHGTETLYFPTRREQGFTSKNIAKVIQKNLTSSVGSFNRGIKKRPDLYVLKHTKMPAVLVEVGFVTNKAEARKLGTKSYRKKAAQSIYKSIKQVLNTYNIGK